MVKTALVLASLIALLLLYLMRPLPVNPKLFDTSPTSITVSKMILSEEEWKEKLTPDEFYIMRQGGDERAFSGAYFDKMVSGTYLCKGCSLPLFSSKDQLSPTNGYLSFSRPLEPGRLYTIDETLLYIPRIQLHCGRCNSHLGLLFTDDEAPFKKRFSLYSLSLLFSPSS